MLISVRPVQPSRWLGAAWRDCAARLAAALLTDAASRARDLQVPADMNIGNVVQHIMDTDKHFGHAAALYDLEYRGVNRLVPVSVLRGMTAVLRDIDPRLFNAAPFDARFCTREELMTAAQDPEVIEEMRPDFVERALARGDECYGIFDGDRLASFGWYSSRPTSIQADLYLHFDPSFRYMYKGFTVGAYRGKRLHGIGMSLALREYTTRGFKGLISYVEANNFASLRSTEKMGYKQFGSVYVARVAGKVVSWSTPGCKPYDFHVDTSSDQSDSAPGSSPLAGPARDAQDRHGVNSTLRCRAATDPVWRDAPTRTTDVALDNAGILSSESAPSRKARALHS